ncbi:MAG: lamin tail domain-containing protein, partial [Chloroflexi bacterium]|nr:lamin tail domain-containing protein [Chloroflexota bacterium]
AAGARAGAGRARGGGPLRITELLPDPEPPGSDGDFEWVELSDLGDEPAQLDGLVLRNNRAETALPERTLPPGASLVIAAPQASLPPGLAHVHALARAIGNRLGNAGDRLALVAADGTILDALSWGWHAAYDNPPLLAPGPGESLRRYFADDGSLLAMQIALAPSPDALEPPPAATEAAAAAAVGGVAVVAFAWQHVHAARG